MTNHFSSVWYATPRRVESITKLIVFDDQGSLDVSEDSFEFRGRKLKFVVQRILRVTLTSQRIPWTTYLILNVVVFAFLLLSSRTSLEVTIVLLAVANLFGLLIGKCTRWVEVEYEGESEEPQRAYFADGSALGWGGIFGGTRRLYRALARLARPGVSSHEPSFDKESTDASSEQS
jgi:hypothetical protein